MNPRRRPAAAQEAEQAGVPLPSVREALAVFQAERPSLLAAFRLAAQWGWDKQVWQLSSSMAESLRLLHYLDDLLTVMETARVVGFETGAAQTEGRALGNLCGVYRELRRFEEAITCYQQSLVIFRETGDRDGEGLALNNLGNAYSELRRFEEAITCYQQSLVIFRETGDRDGEGQALNNLGNTYQEMQQPDRAAACWREAAAAMHDAGDHEEAEVLEQLAAKAQSQRRRWRRRADRSPEH